MDVGVHVTTFDWTGGPRAIAPTLAAIGREVDAAGCRYLTLMDHFLQAEGFMPPEDPIIEGYAGLAFLAAHTTRVQLGMLVTGVTFRNPGVLAKTVTTLDVLSGGRALLGIGGAWYAREHRALGIDFPSAGERLDRLEEAIRICLQLWSADDGPFAGRYYEMAETLHVPAPLHRPHPPILIGGGGERRTLRLVARYADMWNIAAFGLEAVAAKLDVLRRHCDAEGRDIDTIHKTLLWMPDPLDEPTDMFTALEQYAGMGFEAVFVSPYGEEPRRVVEWVATELVPRVRAL